MRNVDLVGRYAGDEFVVAIEKLDKDPEHVLKTITAKIETYLLEKIAQDRADGVINSECNVSIKAGMAIYHRHGIEADVLLEKADKAMYYAASHPVRFVAQSDRVMSLKCHVFDTALESHYVGVDDRKGRT